MKTPITFSIEELIEYLKIALGKLKKMYKESSNF